jgi:hypothetical protein
LPGLELGGGGRGESKKAKGPVEGFAVYNDREDGAEFERTLDIDEVDVGEVRGKAV